MGEQHSQKKGLRSSAQKEDRARDAYAELPASSQAAGAFGKNRRTTPTDKELSLSQATKGSEKGKNHEPLEKIIDAQAAGQISHTRSIVR